MASASNRRRIWRSEGWPNSSCSRWSARERRVGTLFAPNSPGCSTLGQPGTSIWVDFVLLEEITGRLDHLELGLELFDASPGRLQRISIEALDSGALPGVDQRLTPPAIESLHFDAELVDEVFDGFASEHPLTGLSTDFGWIVPWHVWLLCDQSQIVI